MKIALIGYGKMGKEIESIAIERRHTVVLKTDVNNIHEFTCANLQKADVAIEFTTPATAVANLKTCFEAKIPVVCGTTGWLAHLNEVKQYCQNQGGGLFYASNYSIGVNIFFDINRRLAKLMNGYAKDYRTSMEEIHHTAKKDAPSGTAITLANDIIGEIAPLSKWVNSASASDSELPIVSVRQDPAPGTHIVKYTSVADEITICHEAKNRTGFALGAVLAAEFMQGKKGFYGMQDLLQW
ncbi:4-hydroxy-tetrahydrodipicolinate reductase [Bacteroidia bacterium]|nr:4-hydroxy-tetrahydrodipicolinate reductase [Bacteroidia bacterium]